MQVRELPWQRVRFLPFLERRTVAAYLSTAPNVLFTVWENWRFRNPFRRA